MWLLLISKLILNGVFWLQPLGLKDFFLFFLKKIELPNCSHNNQSHIFLWFLCPSGASVFLLFYREYLINSSVIGAVLR